MNFCYNLPRKKVNISYGNLRISRKTIFKKRSVSSGQRIVQINLAASLLSIVAQHNGSDALLTDLLKRDQFLLGNQTISPWFLKSKMSTQAASYKESHQKLDHGELIFLDFKNLLYAIIEKRLPLMLNYAAERQSSQDLLIPKFEIKENAVRVSLILNADGATVCKSPPLSTWPVFIAIADLPPFQWQRFKNRTTAAVYVGNSHPNFNDIFDFLQRERQKSGVINFEGRKITVHLNPILLITDLIGKAKILNMKQWNGFDGCTLCLQRGVHIHGSHRYPHDEATVLRSLESHMANLEALENGSQERLKAKNGRRSDFERKTQGVKGRSTVFR